MTYAVGAIKAKFLCFLKSLSPSDVAKNPGRDFSRHRIFTIERILLTLILWGRDY